MDALTYGSIFPFIIEYITSLPVHVPQDKIGLYAGIAEGGLMFAEAAAAPVWAVLADKLGRKRCATWGFMISVISCGMVGFGRRVEWIIFWRMCIGLNPTPVMSKILITELTQPTNREFIFSIYSPIFNLGYLVGHLIGGWLASPYGRLPFWLGGNSDFLRRWPYALPCLVNSFLGLLAVINGLLFLEETRPPRIHDAEELDGVPMSRERPTTFDLWKMTLKIPHFVLILANFCAYQFAVYAFEGLFTVFAYTPITQGGLGFPVEMIGSIIAFTTLLYIVGSPIIIPRLKRRFGIRRSLTITVITIPIEALIVPIAQWCARVGRVWTWGILVLVQLPLKNFHQMGWPMNDHLNTACFDDYPHLVATGSAITLIAGASGRAFGPAIAGWLFSISTEYPLASFGRQISWISLFLMTLPPVMLSLYIPDGLTKEDQTGNTVLEEGDGNAADIPLIGRGSSEESDDAAREV
ncbi:uncharacterized protein I303_107276 [Kwoniella dejecticola CBS 10117]|uniref:Major facilitator superfamily (MFS) profile domain-containing protein n=1 Tax=Kwoniella dejecticola CBS 10117 TaxID=1296121 RepID=A0AAJ8KVK7_9TREE